MSGVPADQGLSTLGMLLQLAGSMFAALMTMVMLVTLGDASGWSLAIFGLSITRSLVHRNAGKDLLYRTTNRFAGIDLYVVVALAQSVLVGLIAWWRLGMPGQAAFGLFAGLIVWPVCLAFVLARPRFRRFRDSLPIAEDKGFEGTSILMTVLGLSGIADLLLSALVVLALIDIVGGGMVAVALAMLGLLLVRSILHLQAGLSGIRETAFDATVTRAKRYAEYSVVTAFGLCGVLLLFNIAARGHLVGLAIVGTAGWLLVTWPLIVRQFFADRQISELIAGDDAPPHHRAPDAGLTNLGWLLLAHAMLQATFVLPDLFGTPLLLHIGDRSTWFSVGMIVLQTWAGAELIRMSPQARFVGTLFGTVGTLVTLYVDGPMLEMVQHLTNMPSAHATMTFATLMPGLILPPTTLFLVNRNVAPLATARFRT